MKHLQQSRTNRVTLLRSDCDPTSIAAVTVPCDCGWKLGIMLKNLDEIAWGAWGTIRCQKCGARLNDKIRGLTYE